MAKINSIDYSRFQNENYLSYHREFSTFLVKYPIIGERFGYLTVPYLAALEELDDAMKQPTWSDLTKPIAEKDAELDSVIVALKSMVDSMRHYSPTEGVSADAERVYRFIKLNTLNPSAQYDKALSQVSNFLQDMERYCQAEVERMNIQPLLTRMKTLGEEIAALIAERDIQDSLKKSQAVKQGRQKLDTLYVALKDTVNGAAVVDTAGLLTPFINAVNQMIKRNETQVLKQPATGNTKPEGGETPTPTPPGEETPGGEENNPNTPNNPTEGDENNNENNNENNDNNDNTNPGGNQGGNNYPPGYDPDADLDPGV